MPMRSNMPKIIEKCAVCGAPGVQDDHVLFPQKKRGKRATAAQ